MRPPTADRRSAFLSDLYTPVSFLLTSLTLPVESHWTGDSESIRDASPNSWCNHCFIMTILKTATSRETKEPTRVVFPHDLAPFLRTWFNRNLYPGNPHPNSLGPKTMRTTRSFTHHSKRRPAYRPLQRVAIVSRCIEWFDVVKQTSQTVDGPV